MNKARMCVGQDAGAKCGSWWSLPTHSGRTCHGAASTARLRTRVGGTVSFLSTVRARESRTRARHCSRLLLLGLHGGGRFVRKEMRASDVEHSSQSRCP